jgi:hypothetical protein
VGVTVNVENLRHLEQAVHALENFEGGQHGRYCPALPALDAPSRQVAVEERIPEAGVLAIAAQRRRDVAEQIARTELAEVIAGWPAAIEAHVVHLKVAVDGTCGTKARFAERGQAQVELPDGVLQAGVIADVVRGCGVAGGAGQDG